MDFICPDVISFSDKLWHEFHLCKEVVVKGGGGGGVHGAFRVYVPWQRYAKTFKVPCQVAAECPCQENVMLNACTL